MSGMKFGDFEVRLCVIFMTGGGFVKQVIDPLRIWLSDELGKVEAWENLGSFFLKFGQEVKCVEVVRKNV